MFLVNDGALVKHRKIYGNAYGWGYHNNVIIEWKTDTAVYVSLMATEASSSANHISHEMIHCFGNNKYGLFGFKTPERVPVWKWEGYPNIQ